MKQLLINYSYKTIIGNVRKNNEDKVTIFKNDYKNYFLLLSDGMGGHKNGKFAANLIIKFFTKYLKDINFNKLTVDQIMSFLFNISNKIQKKLELFGKKNSDYNDMGATLVLVIIVLKKSKYYAYFYHAGDSRGYINYVKNKKEIFKCVTVDHNIKNYASKRQKLNLGFASLRALIHAFGPNKYNVNFVNSNACDFFSNYINNDVFFFLCSDGVSEFVSENKIRQTINETDSAKSAINKIIDIALKNGSTDNCSCALLKFKK